MHYLIAIVVLLGVVSAIIQFLATIPPLAWVAMGAVLVFGFLHAAKNQQQRALKDAQERESQQVLREAGRQAEASKLELLIAQHSNTLQIRYAALAGANGYGKPDAAAWEREARRFVESVEYKPSHFTWDAVLRLVTETAQRKTSVATQSGSVDWAGALSSPLSFERACAAQLSSQGWQADTTSGSGDQGIDVIARKAGVRAVLQCKLYSQAVGNDAVQEALAGKAFAKAHIAAVVSNAGFTRKAHELAAATGVFLLHHSQLNQLEAEVMRIRQAYAARKAAGTSLQSPSAPTGV